METLERIKEGISLIKEWIQTKKEEFEEKEEFKELVRVVTEIEQENDFSKQSFEDIRYLLRPFEYLPLRIKRLFNIVMMDHYTMFIASRHFESIDDFINLELGVKRFNGNMSKFHYNPISVDEQTVKLFPNAETLLCYDKKEEYIEGGRIQFYVDN